MVNFFKKNTNKPSLLHVYIYIRVHDIHCEPKSYRLKLLKKLIVKDGNIWISPWLIYLSKLLRQGVNPKIKTTKMLECMIYIVSLNPTSLNF